MFCRIASGESPAVKLWEDGSYLALLDIFPNTVGQTLVISRKHLNSYIFELEQEEIDAIMRAARQVAGMLERGLSVRRVNLVFEGLEVDHIHAKLYPVHGIDSRFVSIVPEETVKFNSYPGFVSTLHGPKASREELERVAERIRQFK